MLDLPEGLGDLPPGLCPTAWPSPAKPTPPSSCWRSAHPTPFLVGLGPTPTPSADGVADEARQVLDHVVDAMAANDGVPVRRHLLYATPAAAILETASAADGADVADLILAYHTRAAARRGATPEQLAEALSVALRRQRREQRRIHPFSVNRSPTALTTRNRTGTSTTRIVRSTRSTVA